MVRALDIVVVRGLGVGQRLEVGATPAYVGRSADADLRLADRRVSRRHLEVTATSGGARVRACEGTTQFYVNGQARESCDLVLGDEILVGDTLLVVAERPTAARPDEAPDATATATDVHELLDGGAAGEARGLSALFALVESLVGPRDRAELEACVGAWARRYAGAEGARVVLADDDEVDPLLEPHFTHETELVVERARGGGTVVSVPAHANPAGRMVFAFASAPDEVSLATRRLLAVAGRVGALSVAQLRESEASAAEREDLRRLAIGSARGVSGDSAPTRRLAALVARLASSDATVLLTGETGTGKSFVARVLHESGPRAREPFRVINCAAIPESLLESEVFGHERGAFSGAVHARAGALESAAAGTLFLDEIGELPFASQAKLLRVLEDRRFERLGSNRELTLRARVIAATNRDLAAMVEEGRFRRDLFFRLSVVMVPVPRLAERGDDLVALAERMLSDLSLSAGRRVVGFAPATLEVIRRYPWPGNLRELRNAIERAVVLGDGPRVEPEDLPEAIVAAVATTTQRIAVAPAAAPDGAEATTVQLPAPLAWLEGKAVEAALRATGGNRTRAAALLGIHRMTLVKKLRDEPK